MQMPDGIFNVQLSKYLFPAFNSITIARYRYIKFARVQIFSWEI